MLQVTREIVDYIVIEKIYLFFVLDTLFQMLKSANNQNFECLINYYKGNDINIINKEVNNTLVLQ